MPKMDYIGPPGNGHQPNVPILGQKAKMGAQIGAIPRKLDEHGLFEVDVVQGPNGQPAPHTPRERYMDATELLDAIREIVRAELRVMQDDKLDLLIQGVADIQARLMLHNVQTH